MIQSLAKNRLVDHDSSMHALNGAIKTANNHEHPYPPYPSSRKIMASPEG